MMPEDRKLLYKLIEMETRAEVYARMGPVCWPEYGEIIKQSWEIRDQIRDLMFGTHCIKELAERWGIIKSDKKDRRSSQEGKPKPKKGKKHGTGTCGRYGKGSRKPLL